MKAISILDSADFDTHGVPDFLIAYPPKPADQGGRVGPKRAKILERSDEVRAEETGMFD